MNVYAQRSRAAFLLIVAQMAACSPCSDDVERCSDQTQIVFSAKEWPTGDYSVHFYFPGYAAKCVFTMPEVPTSEFENFSGCEADSDFVNEPETDVSKSELGHLVDRTTGLTTGVSAILIDEELATEYIRTIVVRDGETIFDQQVMDILSGEIGDDCRTCETRFVTLNFP